MERTEVDAVRGDPAATPARWFGVLGPNFITPARIKVGRGRTADGRPTLWEWSRGDDMDRAPMYGVTVYVWDGAQWSHDGDASRPFTGPGAWADSAAYVEEVARGPRARRVMDVGGVRRGR